MAIQALPPFYNMKFVESSGKLSAEANLFHDQTFQALNANNTALNSITSTVVSGGGVTVNGIIAPSLTTPSSEVLASSAAIGTIWYNSTIDKMQFQGAHAIQTISSG